MLIPLPVQCPACGSFSTATIHATQDHPQHTCPHCGASGVIPGHLSVSVVADLLLVRVQSEIDKGDFTVPIILSAMAVETAVSHAFMKWKSIQHYAAGGSLNPTAAEEEAWEGDYRRETMKRQQGLRGFEKEAKFIGTFLVGKSFDDFVAEKAAAAAQPTGLLSASTIHNDLFEKRNSAMHWGKVNFSKEDASRAYAAAVQAIRTVKWMDQEKYAAEETARRASPEVAPPA
jgi:hypothetical protein